MPPSLGSGSTGEFTSLLSDDTVVVRRSRHCYAMPPSLGSGSTGALVRLLSDDTVLLCFMRLSFDCATRSFKFSPQKATLFERGLSH